VGVRVRVLGYVAIVGITTLGGLGSCRSREAGVSGGGEPMAVGKQPCAIPGIKTACATIWVTSSGESELNGEPADLGRVDEVFRGLAEQHGVVIYAREAGQDEPHPTALKVMDLIVKHRLPVSMSTKRDFSDVVGPDGTATPRKAG
jgi:hypothetical protein